MVQGENQRFTIQKPSTGPIPVWSLSTSAGCLLSNLQSQELGSIDFPTLSISCLLFNNITTYLLCARHHAKCWNRAINRGKESPWQFGVYILAEVVDNSQVISQVTLFQTVPSITHKTTMAFFLTSPLLVLTLSRALHTWDCFLPDIQMTLLPHLDLISDVTFKMPSEPTLANVGSPYPSHCIAYHPVLYYLEHLDLSETILPVYLK